MFRLFNKFYSPDDSSTVTPGNNTPASNDKDDVIKFMGEEDEPEESLDLTPPKKEVKPKTKDEEIEEEDPLENEEEEIEEPKEDDEDELEALIDETEPPTDEQLELMAPVRRREILKKYPQLFKDFPYLERAYYREQQFTEILPTIQDAKEAVEKSQTLDRFEKDLMGGNLGTILAAVKDQAPNSFYKIADELMPTLAKVDEKAYYHIIGNNIKHTIVAMVTEGKKTNNEVLLSAAQILNQFTFGSSDFQAPGKLSKDEPKSEKNTELSEREQAFNRRQFETAKGDLNARVNNTLKSTIEQNIDPKSSMTEYVKKQAIREVSESLQSLISQDRRFGTIIDKLWENAFNNNFNKDSLDRIRSAYLSKSRTLLPSVIKKARIEALRGMGKRVREETEDTKPQSKPRSSSGGNNTPTKKGDVPRGMKTIDFLMQD